MLCMYKHEHSKRQHELTGALVSALRGETAPLTLLVPSTLLCDEQRHHGNEQRKPEAPITAEAHRSQDWSVKFCDTTNITRNWCPRLLTGALDSAMGTAPETSLNNKAFGANEILQSTPAPAKQHLSHDKAKKKRAFFLPVCGSSFPRRRHPCYLYP